MAEGLAAAGVTRVSMGAQSFDDRVLAALGRVHDADRVARAVATLRAAGVPAVNLDLIYGGPGEDAGSWAATLAAAVALEPEHLSAYALTIEPATKFGRLVAAGRMAEPAEDDLADRYDTACAVLAGAGTWPGCRRTWRPSTTAGGPPKGRSGSTPARPGSRPWPCGCGRPTGCPRMRPGRSASTPPGRRPATCGAPVCWPRNPGWF